MKNSILTMLCLIWCPLPCAAADISISAAKLLPDSPTSISLSSKVVTYASANYFYIEEDKRNMGIKVEKTAHGLTVGMRADVTGTMKTNTNRERAILASIAAHNGDGTVAPVGMNNPALGGANWNVSGTGGQKGTSSSIGLNNIGLLIKTWGKYHWIDDTTFEINDGAGLNIKCTVPSGTFLSSSWQYVAVTGISSLYLFNSSIYPPNLLVRDIQVVSPVEAVSIPGTPSGNASPVTNISETYSTTGSTCSQGHPIVEYSFNWGDGNSSPWSTSTSASHSWSAAGTKTITVTARCQVHPAVSATSAGLQVNVRDIEMISIPAGSFLMGTPDSYTASHNPDEHPQHSLYLSAYSIGKYEVTRGQYQAFMTATSRAAPEYWDDVQDWGTGAFTQTESHPVVGVTYYDAEAFCTWAGGHLPTEAQWERAARWTGSYPNVYPWGDAWGDEMCNNFRDTNSAGGGYAKYQTAPVGSYSSYPSPSGCQDMAGNVWEWCQDWYKSYPDSGNPFDYTGIYRVLRGGSWGNYDNVTRCAYRYLDDPDTDWRDNGFRLARPAP